MKTCYIYARTATITNKRVINNQVRECLEFATTNDFKVLKVFKDIGSSANNLKRKSFLNLLQSCKQNQVDAIIVLRLDRISRNCHQFSLLQTELKKLSVQLISVHEGELSSLTGTFTGSILTAINQYYSEYHKTP